MKNKIKSRKEIAEIVKRLKKRNKKIVTFNGSFDILHSGHVVSLAEAKKQGDALIVLLNSDASVKKYKSSKRPIIDERNRALMLAALPSVDYIVLFDDINPLGILEKIKPDIHCNGRDWGKNCLERSVVEKCGGIIHVLKWTPGLSTSNIIKKILSAYKIPLKKAIFIEKGISPPKSVKPYLIIKLCGNNRIKDLRAELEHSVKKHDISLNDSWVIARQPEAIFAGRFVNAKTIKLGEKMPTELKLEPTKYAKSIKEAAIFINRQQ